MAQQNELLTILDEILSDKNTNCKSDNLKEDINLLGVDGNLKDTSDATITEYDVIKDKIAYARNERIIGIVENTESFDQILTDNAYSSADGVLVRNDKEYPICLQPNAGLVSPNDAIASAIQLTPDIIKEGTEILGMTGTLKIGVDTTDGTATSDDIALNKIAYVKGNRLVRNNTNS